ncbi:Lrp/AsnC family transcriptional regulator [Parasulfitobacter algicola]|uniref:Lrp/AsnC family transcriptional regulator n=1 Tax=Parasulfitobacter algicola TaxID=2614809 RepID=A0ABX2IQK8_9RHOB|nr:Lrp/AsnC family transcriptional regulator [Sulfitobacter algicola]NSX55167.1 Lrp/AsnC family transcriptional regulator [Sulfitobacter algicola]
MKNTDHIPQNAASVRALDAIDRKILGELGRDATLSFSDLSQRVGLSAPAVHERVKRLKAAGVIKRTVAILDGPALGKTLLAFVHVDTTGWGKTAALMALAKLPEVEEIHSATGDTCLIMKVRVASSEALEGLLSQLYDVDGVRSTRTYVALSTHLERTVQADISDELALGPHIK